MTTPSDNKKALLDQYDGEATRWREMNDRIVRLLSELLPADRYGIHSISGRVKTRKSLAGKIAKDEDKYTDLSAIMDLSGVRITTYFSDDVDRVAKVIQSEFIVDQANSVDKRTALDPDRFGYLSVHYIVSLNAQRASLPEYSRFSGLKTEVQVRSILQHAWAEIEHDLGYKSTHAIPRPIRRRFSRLASLLELADDEFCALRGDIAAYAKQVASTIKSSPAAVALDAVSLTQFADTDPTVVSIESEMASKENIKIVSRPANYMADRTRTLELAGFRNISEVSMFINEHRDIIVKSWLAWRSHLKKLTPGSARNVTTPGAVLFHASLLKAARDKDQGAFVAFVKSAQLFTPSRREELAREYWQIAKPLTS